MTAPHSRRSEETNGSPTTKPHSRRGLLSSIAGWMILIAAVGLLVGLFREAPALAILLGVSMAPALAISELKARKRWRRGDPMPASEQAVWFLGCSMMIPILMAVGLVLLIALLYLRIMMEDSYRIGPIDILLPHDIPGLVFALLVIAPLAWVGIKMIAYRRRRRGLPTSIRRWCAWVALLVVLLHILLCGALVLILWILSHMGPLNLNGDFRSGARRSEPVGSIGMARILHPLAGGGPAGLLDQELLPE